MNRITGGRERGGERQNGEEREKRKKIIMGWSRERKVLRKGEERGRNTPMAIPLNEHMS